MFSKEITIVRVGRQKMAKNGKDKEKSTRALIRDDDSNPRHSLTLEDENVGINRDMQVDTELFFDLFGNDIRRKILAKLSKFPRYASDLAVDLGVSKQATKKHMDKLMEYGLIEESEMSKEYSKKQYYQISKDVALFLNIVVTPNYFKIDAKNKPKELSNGLKGMDHNPMTAMVMTSVQQRASSDRTISIDKEKKVPSKKRQTSKPTGEASTEKEEKREKENTVTDYGQMSQSLELLGKELRRVENEIKFIESKQREMILKKAVLINRIQMLINALVENELEKEVIFSFFFDMESSLEGLTLEDIVDRLFLKKKKRAGVSKFQDYRPDERTLERGKKLLKLLKLLVQNLEFVRTDGTSVFFDFGD